MDLGKPVMQLGLVVLLLEVIHVVLAAAQAKPGCEDQYDCGNVNVSYPFGTVEDCYLSPDFLITCNNTFNPPQAFLRKSNIEVTNINIDDGQTKVLSRVASICHDESGNINATVGHGPSWLSLKKFNISKSENQFIVIGCKSYAYLQGYRDRKNYSAGCMSVCNSFEFVDNTSCSGSGCCHMEIPDGLYNISVTAYSFDNYKNMFSYSPCTHAFVAEKSNFTFSSRYLKYDLVGKKLPLVLDWAINISDISDACKDNAEKYDPTGNPLEYRCRCREGYQGNPYIGCNDTNECENNTHDCESTSLCKNTNGSYTCTCPEGYRGDGRKNGPGCHDINECEDENMNNCTHKDNCINSVGSYSCKCGNWYRGDGRKDGEGCKPIDIMIIFGIGISFIALFLGSSWLYLVLKHRKLIQLKAEFFENNGGLILQQKLYRQEGASGTAKIFTAEELKKATNNYDKSTIVGKGGFGIVYKGILADNREVAIKKSIQVDQSQIEQFINEVVVLSQINHRNVVRLLGCCLETEVPLLVYEFIASGALSRHIHDENKASALSWDIRLRIAVETAGALSYLHSEASIPIIHRDIKTDNILLDANYTAKVSDFGASRLVPLNETQLSTIVQGTCGYLDPEYMQTSQLTEKSDVYSFGVVIVELLTCEKALCFQRPEELRTLAMYFLSSMEVGNLFEILDNRIVNEENKEMLEAMAQLAKRCLSVRREERPSMREVAIELEGLQLKEKHPWVEENSEETEYLLKDQLAGYLLKDTHHADGLTSSSISGHDSIKNDVILAVGDGR